MHEEPDVLLYHKKAVVYSPPRCMWCMAVCCCERACVCATAKQKTAKSDPWRMHVYVYVCALLAAASTLRNSSRSSLHGTVYYQLWGRSLLFVVVVVSLRFLFAGGLCGIERRCVTVIAAATQYCIALIAGGQSCPLCCWLLLVLQICVRCLCVQQCAHNRTQSALHRWLLTAGMYLIVVRVVVGW